MHLHNTVNSLNQQLPMPFNILDEQPATQEELNFVHQTRKKLRRILHSRNLPLILIIGPCSIHDITAAKDYANHLAQLAHECHDTFIIAMRAYFEKPRTFNGWRGLIQDPHLDGSNDIVSGIRFTRQLLLELARIKIAAACEILDPLYLPYVSDLVSWGCIGARSCESQIHRQIASGLPFPVAFKNSTEGSILPAIYSNLLAKQPQDYINIDTQGRLCLHHSNGNIDAHICLRGGNNSTNYDANSVALALKQLHAFNLPQQLFIDCSHGNSKREPEKQIHAFQNVIEQIAHGNQNIRGICIESHLNGGKQEITQTPLKYGISITDACIDWPTTKEIILEARKQLLHSNLSFVSTYAMN